MEQVAHIANTILYQAKKEGVSVSIMKLQKLIYLLYSDFLHCAGQVLFSERFEAWRYGPVLNSIQTAFMNCKPDHMNGYMVDAKGERKRVDIDAGDCFGHCFKRIWGLYAHKTGIELSVLTRKQHGAWFDAVQNQKQFLDDEAIKAEWFMLFEKGEEQGI